MARRLGRFNEARQIWNEKLPPPHTVPVLALERADLEARLECHTSQLEILETTLASQKQ